MNRCTFGLHLHLRSKWPLIRTYLGKKVRHNIRIQFQNWQLLRFGWVSVRGGRYISDSGKTLRNEYVLIMQELQNWLRIFRLSNGPSVCGRSPKNDRLFDFFRPSTFSVKLRSTNQHSVTYTTFVTLLSYSIDY